MSINKETRKKRMENKKNSFAINPEQMEYERRKVLEQMSTKIDRKKLNNMAAVAATKEPEYFDEEGNKREPTMRILSLGAGVQRTQLKGQMRNINLSPDVCQIHLCLLLVLVERLACYIVNAHMTIR